MLPVQTVMIRYMVLVYRWGAGWLGAVGDWVGFVGGDVTGGCARRWAAAAGAVATRPGREKAPPTWGRRGLLGESTIRFCLLLPRQIRLQALQDHSPYTFYPSYSRNPGQII